MQQIACRRALSTRTSASASKQSPESSPNSSEKADTKQKLGSKKKKQKSPKKNAKAKAPLQVGQPLVAFASPAERDLQNRMRASASNPKRKLNRKLKHDKQRRDQQAEDEQLAANHPFNETNSQQQQLATTEGTLSPGHFSVAGIESIDNHTERVEFLQRLIRSCSPSTVLALLYAFILYKGHKHHPCIDQKFETKHGQDQSDAVQSTEHLLETGGAATQSSLDSDADVNSNSQPAAQHLLPVVEDDADSSSSGDEFDDTDDTKESEQLGVFKAEFLNGLPLQRNRDEKPEHYETRLLKLAKLHSYESNRRKFIAQAVRLLALPQISVVSMRECKGDVLAAVACKPSSNLILQLAAHCQRMSLAEFVAARLDDPQASSHDYVAFRIKRAKRDTPATDTTDDSHFAIAATASTSESKIEFEFTNSMADVTSLSWFKDSLSEHTESSDDTRHHQQQQQQSHSASDSHSNSHSPPEFDLDSQQAPKLYCIALSNLHPEISALEIVASLARCGKACGVEIFRDRMRRSSDYKPLAKQIATLRHKMMENEVQLKNTEMKAMQVYLLKLSSDALERQPYKGLSLTDALKIAMRHARQAEKAAAQQQSQSDAAVVSSHKSINKSSSSSLTTHSSTTITTPASELLAHVDALRRDSAREHRLNTMLLSKLEAKHASNNQLISHRSGAQFKPYALVYFDHEQALQNTLHNSAVSLFGIHFDQHLMSVSDAMQFKCLKLSNLARNANFTHLRQQLISALDRQVTLTTADVNNKTITGTTMDVASKSSPDSKIATPECEKDFGHEEAEDGDSAHAPDRDRVLPSSSILSWSGRPSLGEGFMLIDFTSHAAARFAMHRWHNMRLTSFPSATSIVRPMRIGFAAQNVLDQEKFVMRLSNNPYPFSMRKAATLRDSMAEAKRQAATDRRQQQTVESASQPSTSASSNTVSNVAVAAMVGSLVPPLGGKDGASWDAVSEDELDHSAEDLPTKEADTEAEEAEAEYDEEEEAQQQTTMESEAINHFSTTDISSGAAKENATAQNEEAPMRAETNNENEIEIKYGAHVDQTTQGADTEQKVDTEDQQSQFSGEEAKQELQLESQAEAQDQTPAETTLHTEPQPESQSATPARAFAATPAEPHTESSATPLEAQDDQSLPEAPTIDQTQEPEAKTDTAEVQPDESAHTETPNSDQLMAKDEVSLERPLLVPKPPSSLPPPPSGGGFFDDWF